MELLNPNWNSYRTFIQNSPQYTVADRDRFAL